MDAASWLDGGALLVLNTVSVVLFQVTITRRVTGLDSTARQVRIAGVVLLACEVFALPAAGSSAGVAVVVPLVVATLGSAGARSGGCCSAPCSRSPG